MRKIPTLFVRDPEDMRFLTREVNPDAAWVLEGEGVPTRKRDGVCLMLDEEGRWWARREVKPSRAYPPNYWVVETDAVTGKTYGWEPLEQSPWINIFRGIELSTVSGPGTYEMCGPMINRNPESLGAHWLFRHGAEELMGDVPLTYIGLQTWLLARPTVEGIVWHHADGRMAKIKRRDFVR
jgi:Family of unknown function (DUF5565)